jgi:hypothetical protein
LLEELKEKCFWKVRRSGVLESCVDDSGVVIVVRTMKRGNEWDFMEISIRKVGTARCFRYIPEEKEEEYKQCG